MTYILVGLVTFFVSALLTIAVRSIATRFDITDKPKSSRKIHKQPIPLLGGVGIYVALFIVIFGYCFFAPEQWLPIFDSHVKDVHLIGIFFGALFLIVGGALDDRYDLKPYQQILWPIAAVITVIASGVGVDKITNPFGGILYLDQVNIALFSWHGVTHYFTLWSDILTFVWLLTVIYTTKFLDGLDGLVSGMTVIGAIIIGLLSIFFFVNVPTAMLCAIVAGAFAGFLVFNYNPASIFLGESGSTLAGFLLGVLAIISGAKVATTLLVLGIPVLDAIWVLTRRVFIDKKSPFVADRKHIHFRLLDVGLTQRQAVWVLYSISATFGITALFLQSAQKLIGLFILLLVMSLMALILLILGRKNTSNKGF